MAWSFEELDFSTTDGRGGFHYRQGKPKGKQNRIHKRG